MSAGDCQISQEQELAIVKLCWWASFVKSGVILHLSVFPVQTHNRLKQGFQADRQRAPIFLKLQFSKAVGSYVGLYLQPEGSLTFLQ